MKAWIASVDRNGLMVIQFNKDVKAIADIDVLNRNETFLVSKSEYTFNIRENSSGKKRRLSLNQEDE